MTLVNLNDDAIEDLKRRVRALENTAGGGFTAVTRGRTRFVGNESVLVEGSGKVVGWWIITGTQRITGRCEGSGTFDWTGPAWLRGATGIDGDLDVTGKTRLRGQATLESDLEIIAPGKIKVGDMIIEKSGAEGRITFANGARLSANPGGGAKLFYGLSELLLTADGVIVSYGSSYGRVTVGANGIGISGVPTAASATGLEWLAVTSTGQLRRVAQSVGGPRGSGEFSWPFPLSAVTDEYGPRSIGDGFHDGIDFGVAAGSQIKAPSGGKVLQKGYDAADRGHWIALDHGDRGGGMLVTRYFHMQAASSLAVGAVVAKNAVIGLVGNTGFSTGPHLHWETLIGGSGMNPRTFMSMYGS